MQPAGARACAQLIMRALIFCSFVECGVEILEQRHFWSCWELQASCDGGSGDAGARLFTVYHVSARHFAERSSLGNFTQIKTLLLPFLSTPGLKILVRIGFYVRAKQVWRICCTEQFSPADVVSEIHDVWTDLWRSSSTSIFLLLCENQQEFCNKNLQY